MTDPFEQLLSQAKETAGTATNTGELERKIKNLFSSPAGEEVLDLLSQLWVDIPLFVLDNPHYTTYKVAQADLINTIKDIVRGDT